MVLPPPGSSRPSRALCAPRSVSASGQNRGVVVVRGEGLELRPLTRTDAVAMKAGEDSAQTAAFEFPGPAPLADVTAAIDRWQESWAHDGPVRNFGIWDSTGERLVGNVEVRSEGDGRVNLSYVVFPEFRRAAVATRASRLALDYAATALDATTAIIKVLDWNAASIGVARSLGAHLVGTEESEARGRLLVFELVLDRAHPE